MESYEQTSRTVHDHCDISDQTVNDLESLRNDRAGLLLGESVESLKHRFDFVLSQKLFCIFLCGNVKSK